MPGSCRACGLWKTSRRCRVPGEGNPHATLVLVGEALGESEESQGRPFIGRAGGMLDQCLAQAGISRADIWITNSVRCRPTNAAGQNRKPSLDEIHHCRGFLDDELAILTDAKVIVTLGAVAATSLLGPLAPSGGVLENQGKILPVPGRDQLWALLSVHPAYLLHKPGEMEHAIHDFTTAHRMAVYGGPIPRKDPVYRVVRSLADLAAMEADLATADKIAFDWETNGLHLTRSRGFCLSFSGRPDFGWVVPRFGAGFTPFWARRELQIVDDTLRRILLNPIPKVGFHIAFDLAISATTLGFDLWEVPVAGDPHIGHHLVANHLGGRSHGLKRMSDRYTAYGRYDDELDHWLIARGHADKGVADHGYLWLAPNDLVWKYAATDSIVTYLLDGQMLQQIQGNDQLPIYLTERIPLVREYADMDRTGLRIDQARLAEQGDDVGMVMAALNGEINTVAEREVNPNSHPQVRKLLFEDCGYPVLEFTAKEHLPSTKEEVLKELSNLGALPELILHYRMFGKLKGSFIDGKDEDTPGGLKAAIDPDGRARMSTILTGTETFRCVTRKPFPVHTLPRPLEMFRCPVHGQYVVRQCCDLAAPTVLSIRGNIIPPDGYVFGEADFKQQEFALAAIASFQQDWEEAIFDRGEDAHEFVMGLLSPQTKKDFGASINGSWVWHSVVDEIMYKNLRARFKTINFSLLYRAGAKKLARSLSTPADERHGIPARVVEVEEAQRIIQDYYERLDMVKRWQYTIVQELRRTGRVQGLFKTFRVLPGIWSTEAMDQFEAERQACNFPFQDGGAHVTMRAIVTLGQQWRKQGRGPAASRAAFPARIAFSVHDEIVTEIREDVFEEGAAMQQAAMEQVHPELVGACGVARGIAADVKKTRRWSGVSEARAPRVDTPAGYRDTETPSP